MFHDNSFMEVQDSESTSRFTEQVQHYHIRGCPVDISTLEVHDTLHNLVSFTESDSRRRLTVRVSDGELTKIQQLIKGR